MRRIIVTLLLIVVRTVSRLLYSHKIKFVGDVPEDKWENIRVIAAATGLPRPEAEQLLHTARGRAKTAIVMHLLDLPRREADALLDTHGGQVRNALRADRHG